MTPDTFDARYALVILTLLAALAKLAAVWLARRQTSRKPATPWRVALRVQVGAFRRPGNNQ